MVLVLTPLEKKQVTQLKVSISCVNFSDFAWDKGNKPLTIQFYASLIEGLVFGSVQWEKEWVNNIITIS